MRSSVLITTITAAFLAGTSIVSAQNTSPGQEKQEPKVVPSAPKQEPKVAPKAVPNAQIPNAQINVAPKAQNNAPAQAQEKAKDQSHPSAQKSAPTTTGQGTPPTTAQQPAQNERAKQNDRSNATAGQGASQPNPSTAQSQAAGRIALTAEQKATIRQSVLGGRNAPQAGSVNFSMNVGTEIPRSVRLVSVPEPIYRYHPEWRSFLYFVVGDEVIIVDARTHRIVAVFDV